MPDDTAYAFGDSALALARLELLAELFAPEFDALLRRTAALVPRPRLALDLGCGIGATTRALSAVLRAARTIGLDVSTAMVQRAALEGGDAAISFAEHDVTAIPLPEAPAEVISARLLLPHLVRPTAAIARWITQLAPGGHLLLDEVASIASDDAVIARYLDITSALLDARGSGLYVAASLPSQFDGAVTLHDAPFALPLPNTGVARMFRMNLDVWRADAAALGIADAATLGEIASGLDQLAGEADGVTTWTMRHLVLRAR